MKDDYYNYTIISLDINYNGDKLFMNEWMNDYYYYRNQEQKETEPIDLRSIFFLLTAVFIAPVKRSILKELLLLNLQGNKE